MRKLTLTTLTLLVALALTLVACGEDESLPEDPIITATVPTDPTVPPPAAGTAVDAITGTAFVEELGIAPPNAGADEVQVTVRGNLNDVCTHIESIDVTDVEGTTFQVTVSTWRETDAVCAQQLVPFEETIAIDVSDRAPGTYTVEVDGESATFTLPEPGEAGQTPEPAATLLLASGSVAPGGTVEVNGNHFPPNSAVQLGAGPQNSEYEIIATATTGAGGAFSETVTLPDIAGPGETWVMVAVWDDSTLLSEPFAVTAAPTPEAPTATLQVTPTSAAPGATLRLSGSGFPANTAVDVGTGPRNSEYEIFATVQADAQGNVDNTVTLPDFVEAGETWVLVADWDGNKVVSNPITITSSNVNVPLDGRFTRTQIYLIAPEDAGQSGREIGCGDSVLPVEVEIEPTIAPLRAALAKLLAVDDEFYGQSGLYNALHRSNLQVEGIDIVNREAIIHLSGELVLGGACDAPRVDAQLTQTALQFSTVDAVTIRIDGTPLPDLLSGQ